MAVAEKAKEKMLMLRSSDNQEFEVKESVAMQSMTLKKMIEDGCADKGIPLPNVTSHILAKVIEYCNKHAEPTGQGDAAGATNKSAEDELKIFDADFVNVEHSTLFDLILAANYLDIKGLLNLTRQTITDLIKGKMPEEVRETNIKNDLTVPSTSALATTMPSSARKQMEARFNAYMVHWQETAEERMTVFAVLGEKCRKHGHRPREPPLEIVKYPELLERAWGWHSILPYCRANSWSLYKTYLHEYYERNSPEVLAHQVEANAATVSNLNRVDGNDLATLFNLCISMEVQLLNLLKRRDQEYNVDEISLSDKLINCAHQITNVEHAGFPFPSIALKCIMAESDLLCELLMCETGIISQVNICSKIRKFAFRFMTYKGPGCFAVAATMMATTKEAKLMSELLRNRCRENNGPFSRSVFIRKCTFAAMFRICEECSAVEESTGGCTATTLILDGSDDRNPSDKELVNKDNLLQRNKINQNTKISYEEELSKENHLEERNEAKQDESYGKTGSEMGIVGDNPGEMSMAKQTTKCSKEEQLNADNLNESKNQEMEGSLKEDVVQVNTKLMDHKKHKTKLEHYLNTSSVGFDETTLLSLNKEKQQGKTHTRFSGKADGHEAKSAELLSLGNEKEQRKNHTKCMSWSAGCFSVLKTSN